MRITKIEDLHCNAGWRDFSFLKISTDEGLVGWSEFMESYGSEGLAGVIRKLGSRVIGWDPRAVEKITAYLHGVTRQSAGGIAQQAIAAIENALVDLKAKALGIPVYEMLGGPEPYVHMPGFNGPGWPELNITRDLVDGLVAQMTAFRNGAGPKVGLHLDLNFNFKTEGYIRLAQALEPFDLVWLEVDSYDPAALATIRRSARTRIASLEYLHRRRQFRPFFEHQSVDVAIIDVAWNGIFESMKMAAMADTDEGNDAPPNFNGHIGSLMSAHMCTAIPNFKVMEIDIEDVPWKDDLVTPVPRIEDGELLLPTGIGWGAEVNEAGVKAHPPVRP